MLRLGKSVRRCNPSTISGILSASFLRIQISEIYVMLVTNTILKFAKT
jgi:hypothetical protein